MKDIKGDLSKVNAALDMLRMQFADNNPAKAKQIGVAQTLISAMKTIAAAAQQAYPKKVKRIFPKRNGHRKLRHERALSKIKFYRALWAAPFEIGAKMKQPILNNNFPSGAPTTKTDE